MSLVFRAGTLLCALQLQDVIETLRPLAVQPLFGQPPFVRGVSIVRGAPVPVIDVALLLGGQVAEVSRFITVRTDRGSIALATGDVLDIRSTASADDTTRRHAPLLGTAARLIAAIATLDGRPLLVLHNMRLVPDDVWTAAAKAGPS